VPLVLSEAPGEGQHGCFIDCRVAAGATAGADTGSAAATEVDPAAGSVARAHPHPALQLAEEAYVRWCRTFIRFHGLRHPADLGGPEVEAFPTWLACERSVAASTHKQALSALLVSVLSGAGCAATVDGRARPASGPPSTSGGADERGAGRRLPRPGRRTFAIREIALRHRYAPERGVAPAGQVTWTSPIVRWLCVPARAARTDSSCCRKA
jgi:Phage integrase, N-terminal SAM-like domain